MTNQAGKGSATRPRDNRYCTAEQYAENHARVFGKPKPPKTSRVRSTVIKDGKPKPGPMIALDEDGLRIEP